MKLHRRRHGAQRGFAPIDLVLETSYWPGQVQLRDPATGIYYFLVPETEEEVHALLSAVHIVHHNFEG